MIGRVAPLRELWRPWLVAAIWLAVARLFTAYGVIVLPRGLVRQLGLHGYLVSMLTVATIVGLLLARWLMPRPTEAMGLVRPSVTAMAAATLLAPIVLALSAYLAFRLALPTLIAEIAAGGRQAAERNTGVFGRALIASHPALTVAWAVAFTPIAEELLFRGALYEALSHLIQPGARKVRALSRHGLAVVATTMVFAWMHADQPGGAGIVRVVQAASLGLALGLVRAASGSIVPAICLHALFNLMTLAKVRGWIQGPIWPYPLPIVLWWWQLAAAATPLLALLTISRWPRGRAIAIEGSIHLTEPAPEIEVAAPALPAPPRWLVAHDEIRWEIEPEGDGSALRYTLSWTLTSALLRPLAAPLARGRALALRRMLVDRAGSE
jgi:membrane protease YdiL (CAAX protease family)